MSKRCGGEILPVNAVIIIEKDRSVMVFSKTPLNDMSNPFLAKLLS